MPKAEPCVATTSTELAAVVTVCVPATLRYRALGRVCYHPSAPVDQGCVHADWLTGEVKCRRRIIRETTAPNHRSDLEQGAQCPLDGLEWTCRGSTLIIEVVLIIVLLCQARECVEQRGQSSTIISNGGHSDL